MSKFPLPDGSPSLSRFALPAFAVLVVIGVIVGAVLLTSEGNHPVPPANPRAAQTQPASGSHIEAPSKSNSVVVKEPQNALPLAPTAPVGSKQGPATGVQASLPPRPANGAEALVDPQPARPALAPGERATAQATVGGARTPPLAPNQWGAFPRVYLPIGGQADVQVQLPDANPGERVVASVEDGGRFADGKPVQAFTLDENRQIAFQFQASSSTGNFRVNVRHGAQTKVVTFWAGDRTLAINH